MTATVITTAPETMIVGTLPRSRTFSKLHRALLDDGYLVRYRRNDGAAEGVAHCKEMICDRCHAFGLGYQRYEHPVTGSVVELAYCQCGHGEEI